MSSPNELDDMELDFEEVTEAEDTPPEAFYLALKRALSQLETEPASGQWL